MKMSKQILKCEYVWICFSGTSGSLKLHGCSTYLSATMDASLPLAMDQAGQACLSSWNKTCAAKDWTRGVGGYRSNRSNLGNRGQHIWRNWSHPPVSCSTFQHQSQWNNQKFTTAVGKNQLQCGKRNGLNHPQNHDLYGWYKPSPYGRINGLPTLLSSYNWEDHPLPPKPDQVPRCCRRRLAEKSVAGELGGG